MTHQVTYAAYPIFISTILMITMTVVCWWAFTYTREGFIPQMYGSIRACCASTSELTDFSAEGILWGDCKHFVPSLKLRKLIGPATSGNGRKI